MYLPAPRVCSALKNPHGLCELFSCVPAGTFHVVVHAAAPVAKADIHAVTCHAGMALVRFTRVCPHVRLTTNIRLLALR